MASLLQDEWRGLAHFRTESRRRVFKKTPAERTASELYVLEEVFSDVKIINNLPFSKRLEICKFINYEDVPENTVVYEEGDEGDKFFVIFTGSVKVTATFGRKQKLLNTLCAGDYFGEAAFLHEHFRRRESVTTLRRCELLTLSKEDYEAALKTNITEEVRANFKTLQNVSVLQKIPKGGLYRLASLLSSRSFTKNRVITFQGEEAREMYFIKSGECRVVMTVKAPVDASPRSLPRAASSLSQYSPTTHDHCKQAVKDVQKHWGHPQFLTRPLSCPSSRSQSVPPISLTPLPSFGKSMTSASSCPDRPLSAPDSRVTFEDRCVEERPLSDRKQSEGVLNTSAHPRDSEAQLVRSSSARGHPHKKSDKQKLHPKQRHTLPFLPSSLKQAYLEQQEGDKPRTPERSKSGRQSRRLRPSSQMSLRSYKARKGGEGKDYSLDTLLKEINQKFCDESIQDLEFSDKEALAWGMGTFDTGLRRGDVTDPVNYQNKFEVWARSVLNREKRMQVIDENSEDDETVSSASSRQEMEMDRLLKTGTILDVGGLHAGEFFGEAALLTRGPRSASILSVTDVEVLVLSNADFSRRLDKDIIECLSANNYKKTEVMLNQYNRTYKWELVKRRVMRDALLEKKERFPNRFYHDMNDAIKRKGTPLL